MPAIEFAAADGTLLEGRLAHPDESRAAAVLCHPLPHAGGSMDSWMMPVLERALVADGWTTLRFNFRGVGGSEPGGDGDELTDLAGAVERVLGETGGDAALLVAGWSFGAHVALRYALGDARVAGWFGVGLPCRIDDVDLPDIDRDDLAGWERPKLFIHGSRDQLTSVGEVEALYTAAAEPKRLRVVEGGDHFLAEYGDVLAEEVRRFGREVLGR